MLDTGESGVLPQADCDLSAVLDREQTEVAVALLEHEVVCLPDLLWGGSEGKPGVCEARFGEGGVSTVFVAVFLGLGGSEVGGNSGAPGVVGGCHFGVDEQSFLV